MDELKVEIKRPWKCKNGHVLGQLRRVRVDYEWGRGHETRLLVFRNAIDLKAEKPAEVDVLMVLPASSSTPAIFCDVEGCGAKRPWDFNKDLLDKLIAMTKKGR